MIEEVDVEMEKEESAFDVADYGEVWDKIDQIP